MRADCFRAKVPESLWRISTGIEVLNIEVQRTNRHLAELGAKMDGCVWRGCDNGFRGQMPPRLDQSWSPGGRLAVDVDATLADCRHEPWWPARQSWRGQRSPTPLSATVSPCFCAQPWVTAIGRPRPIVRGGAAWQKRPAGTW